MSYLSFYSPLLRELGQGSVHLARTMPVWGSDVRVDHGFGDADIHETLSTIQITADLPGVKRADIQVHCNGDVLSISGKRQEIQTLTDDVYNSVERAFGSVCKHIRLPHNVDVSKITARYTDGVLSVDIPKPIPSTEPGREVSIPVLYNVC
ncbi:heat shock protein HSP20 [Blastocystis sp. subtype 4]|uniref:heat shock protein HSP20 n=1 Tax=Blastocystis sp. subtype 4 TaxID=944170 RepID=UPI000711BAD3|nr:heat shock protein HSP20 [Blastocystis sp. subtype 4]KNB44411.1 heat shock protein HSP20 [Blastocystis sp. subtype 4]|eukprot:XP_014527854.1 heat shock protein HSP20 [Blastocystis sp. subtype 4]